MDQNVKENKVNQICAAMREIDSYKYGLHSKVVSMVQVSILVFITEKCIDNDFNYINELNSVPYYYYYTLYSFTSCE
mgnify:CR=1 FL=1